MNSASEKPPTKESMIAELTSILVVMTIGLCFVYILASKLLTNRELNQTIGFPLLFGIIIGIPIAMVFLHPEEWKETEEILQTIELLCLAVLIIFMIPILTLKDPNLSLCGLSIALGITFGVILVVIIKSYNHINEWSDTQKNKDMEQHEEN